MNFYMIYCLGKINMFGEVLKWLKEVARTKTIKYCFCRVQPPKARSQQRFTAFGDYATVEGVALTRNLSSRFPMIIFAKLNSIWRSTQVVEEA